MINEDEVGLKEEPERRYYRYINKIKEKTRSTGSAGNPKFAIILIPTLPLLGVRTRESAGASHLKAPSGKVKHPGQVAPTSACLILVPPRPKEEVERILLPSYDFVIMVPKVGDGDPSFPVHGLLSVMTCCWHHDKPFGIMTKTRHDAKRFVMMSNDDNLV